MLLTALGREISCSAPQPSNIRLETAVNLSGRCTRSSAAQPEKANAPISAIVSGRKTLRNACPSAVSAGGSVTKERLASFSSPISAWGASFSAANALSATAMTGSPSILAGTCSSAQRPCSFFSTTPPSFFSYSICMDKFSFAIGIFLSSVHPLPVRFRNFFVFFTCPLCPLCLSSVHPFSYCIHYILLETDCQFRHKKALQKGGLEQSKS